MEQNVNVIEMNALENEEINKVLFVLFAEFLGYESAFVDWAEDICEGVVVEDFIRTLVERDADYIFYQMTKEYTLAEIRGWFNEFYDVILKEYDESLKEMARTNTNVTA